MNVSCAPLSRNGHANVVAAVASARARVVRGVSRVVVGVVVGGARRCVRVASVARARRAKGCVSQEEVVFSVALVARP